MSQRSAATEDVRQALEGYEQLRRTCDWWIAHLSRGNGCAVPAGQEKGSAACQVEAAFEGAEAQPIGLDEFEEMFHRLTPEPMRQIARAIFVSLSARLHVAESRKAGFLALAALREIQRQLGGGPMYITSGHYEESARVQAEIAKRFDGRNLNELAREFRLTTRRVKQILDAQTLAQTRSRGMSPVKSSAAPAKTTRIINSDAGEGRSTPPLDRPVHPWRR